MGGLQVVYERDGILPSEQVRRAVRAWLESKGVIAAKERGNTPEKKSRK